MGVATGEALETDGDYFGPVFNRVARVMDAAGGQVLVASSTAALVDGVDLVDLGEHRLRDLAAATRLFQVRAPGLATSFPPLGTLERAPGNLPVMATRFIGREIELTKLVDLVPDHRLVTLTGFGEVGKTRLAIQMAAELLMNFDDGVWLAELAPVADPGRRARGRRRCVRGESAEGLGHGIDHQRASGAKSVVGRGQTASTCSTPSG
jgi:hypothetical protein